MLLYTFYFYRPFFLLILPSPPSSTLFPYTTLFRSYLKHVISNIVTLRRYDQSRPVALYCSENHLDLIQQSGLEHYLDRKSTRLNSSHVAISYAVFCLKKKNK